MPELYFLRDVFGVARKGDRRKMEQHQASRHLRSGAAVIDGEQPKKAAPAKKPEPKPEPKPEAEPEPEPVAEEKPDVEEMTKAELVAHAKAKGVDLAGLKKKSEIKAVVKAELDL